VSAQSPPCGGAGCCVSGICQLRYVCNADCICQFASPIIVDTAGEGFHLTSAKRGVVFDIAATGHPIQMAWTAATSRNAFLALDRNHNGKIDNGKELFGNFTEQPKSYDPNGFLALAEFDKPENGGNGDGIIDERDAVFSQLLLWIDENHDGISQPNELHTLPELGVFSLALKYRESRRTDKFGNEFRYKAAVNPEPPNEDSKDGRWMFDVFFLTTGRDDRALPSQVEGLNPTRPPCGANPPVITSIDPAIAMIGSSGTSVTINGYYFGTSPTVNLPTGFGTTGQGFTDTKIVLTGVSIAFSATVGNNNISVTASGQNSGPSTFQVDGPYHMIVQSDVTGLCSGCSSTVARRVTYQVQNFSGTNAATTWIAENIAFSGWSCTQQEGHQFAQCSQNDQTLSSGTFTDQWTMSSDAYTPAGCGFNVTYDHWQWCQHSTAQTLGTLTGYVHTDKVSINGVVSPNKIATGTVIPF
jgi:hypothetical protein